MKHLLDDEYEFDFILIGISCHEKDYRICWAINKALGISLQKEETDIEVLMKKSKQLSLHSCYTYFEEQSEVEYRLISNRSIMGYLIPEKPQADFLLMITDNFAVDFAKIETRIKEIAFVLTTFNIDVETLKSKENLIF